MKFFAPVSLIAALALASSAGAVTVDYTTVADGTYASVILGGTTVTGSADVTSSLFGGFRGLGILGGGNSSLDPAETMTINLGGLSANVLLTYVDIFPVGNVPFSIEAFNGATSLGVFQAPFAANAPEELDISILIGDLNLTSFTIAVGVGAPMGLQIQQVAFTTVSVRSVPDSGSTLALFTLCLIALGAARSFSGKKH